MTATEFFTGFWWLIFPIMGFAMGGFGMFMRHRQSEKALDILKAYADQGKEPPPEVLRAVYGHASPMDGPMAPPPGAPPPGVTPTGAGPAPGYGPGPGYGQGYDPRGYGPGYGSGYGPGWGGPWGWGGGPWGSWRAYRWGPFWAWRRVFIFTSLAIGFGVAAWYEGGRDAEGFVIAAMVMGVLAASALLTAVFQHLSKPR